jgi:hypothetical protein
VNDIHLIYIGSYTYKYIGHETTNWLGWGGRCGGRDGAVDGSVGAWLREVGEVVVVVSGA